MSLDVIRWIVLAWACVPLLYMVFAVDTGRRFFRTARRPQPAGALPPISVLKPLQGVESDALERLTGFCTQDYPAYEVLFAVEDETDPAVAIVHRLMDRFPHRRIRLIVGAAPLGPSRKVRKLCALAREASYDLLVVSDSDMIVEQGYLRSVAAAFGDPEVGAVTCLYRGRSDGRIRSDLEALGISTEFIPSVLVARRVEGIRFAFGATMAVRRAVLEEIGGFESLVDFCADDFELGHRVALRGHRVELASTTLVTACASATLREFMGRELRWAVTVRHARPSGFWGRFLITHALPWSLAAAACAPSAGIAAAYLAAYGTLRGAVAHVVAGRGLGDDLVRRRWWLLPVWDTLSFAFAVAAIFTDCVTWRGRRYELRRGILVPLARLPGVEPVRRGSIAVLLALTTAIYVGSAARPGLLDDADGCHALAAREILQRHDWTVLYVNGIRWLEKPPLHYWLVAASYALFGESAFSTRLPVALAMVALVLLLYEFGRRFFGERAGFYAGLAMATFAGAFLFTRIMIPDALSALEFTAAFYLFLRAWTGTLARRIGCWAAAALIGLATLTRAGIGGVFPIGILTLFVLASGALRPDDVRTRLAAIPVWSSAAIALAVALPWHLAASLETPGFAWFYFVNEQVLRAIGMRYPPDYTAVPLGVWWAAHAAWLFPWLFFLPHAWRAAVGRDGDAPHAAAQARLLLVVWVATVFAFFSIVSGSRMEYYSFAAWPAVALLIGAGLAHADAHRAPWMSRLDAAIAVVGIMSAAALGAFLWMSRGLSGSSDITSLLGRHDVDFYRVSMATLLDLTPQTFAVLRTPALVAALALAAGPAAAWWLWRRGEAVASRLALASTMAMFCAAANLAFEAFEPRLSSRGLAADARTLLAPADRLVVYGEFDQACSFSFYAERTAWVYNGRYNGLEYGSRFPDAPRIFLDDAQFRALWSGADRVFLFVPPEQRDAAARRLPAASTFVAAQKGGKLLYTNHPLARSSTQPRHSPIEPSPSDAIAISTKR